MLPRRVLTGLLAVFALWSATPSASPAEIDCGPAIPATMLDTMSTAHAYPGERFRFMTTAPAKHAGLELPIGTKGWGIVRYVQHARTRNRGGLIVLEPRILVVGSTELNVMADPRETAEFAPAYTLAEEGLGLTPIGVVRTAIDLARYGREVMLGPGFNFHIIIVDDIAENEPCMHIAATPTPAPLERRQSLPSPSPAP